MTQYKTVYIGSLAGHEQAERLLARGWTIYRSGMFYLYLKRKGKK